MHQADGLVAADGIFRILPDVPIVMFTLYKADELEHAANLMGLRCVVGKEEGVQTFLSAIDNELMQLGNKNSRTTSSRHRSIPKESIFPRSFGGFDSEILAEPSFTQSIIPHLSQSLSARLTRFFGTTYIRGPAVRLQIIASQAIEEIALTIRGRGPGRGSRAGFRQN